MSVQHQILISDSGYASATASVNMASYAPHVADQALDWVTPAKALDEQGVLLTAGADQDSLSNRLHGGGLAVNGPAVIVDVLEEGGVAITQLLELDGGVNVVVVPDELLEIFLEQHMADEADVAVVVQRKVVSTCRLVPARSVLGIVLGLLGV